MARFTVTPAAAARLRQMIANDKRGRTLVAVYWDTPKVDKRRGPNGETQWIHEAEAMWKVVLVGDDAAEGQKPEVVDDLQFLVIERLSKPKLTGRTIDHVAEAFVVK